MSLTLRELESLCQKPGWREVGSLLACRFARPVALYVTWLVVRWPVSANMVTTATLVVALTAAVLLGVGSSACFVAGAIVLQLWYVLDHVDGQVARLRRGESVTGIYFDFMMHHIVHPAVAFALGFGIAARTGDLVWTLAGAAFALGVVMLSLSNDCRYKAFFAALKKSGGRRAEGAAPEAKRNDAEAGREDDSTCSSGVFGYRHLRFAIRFLQKSCEMPNIIIAITLLAVSLLIKLPAGSWAIQIYLAFMATVAPVLGLARLVKQVWLRSPDAEFLEFVSTGNELRKRTG